MKENKCKLANVPLLIIALAFTVHAKDGGPGWNRTAGLVFEPINNNTAYRVKEFTFLPYGGVDIPSYYDGKPVTEIGVGAFSGAYIGASYGCYGFSITGISIPSSVTIISSGAFTACIEIASISIPGSVTSIGGSAFARWTAAQTIYINGHASQAAADAAWGADWRLNCNAVIKYLGES